MSLPPYPDSKNEQRTMVDINDQRLTFTILDEILRPQSNLPEKLIVLQKIQFDESKAIEFRLAYYIIGKKPRMAGKWVFGQYATLMPAEDFHYIFAEAKKRGWL